MVKAFLKKSYIYLLLLFLYAPIIVLAVYSFNDSKSRGGWDGFTLRWYKELFSNRQIMSALRYTIIIAIIAAVVATIIGTLTALGLSKLKPWAKVTLLNINYLPVLNPDILTGVSLMILFLSMGMNLGFTTLLLSHIVFCIPYVILSVLPKIKQLPANTVEAAMDLGATPMYTLRKVILPQIKPGIVTGFLIAFTMSIDDFVISYFNTGGGVSNLSISIFSMARKGISPTINALSTLMFIVILALLLIVNKRTSDIDE